MRSLGSKRAFADLGIITAILAALATFLSYFGGDYEITDKPNIDGIHLDVSCEPSTQSQSDRVSLIDGNQSDDPFTLRLQTL